jgi:hypothetical protein
MVFIIHYIQTFEVSVQYNLGNFQILMGAVYSNCALSVRLKVVGMMYSNQELANEHFMCSLVNSNAVVTRHLYQER